MWYAQKENGWDIDWQKAYHYFTDNRETFGAFYFTPCPGPNDPEQVMKYRRFKGFLVRTGYKVIDREIKVIRNLQTGDVQTKTKGNLDIELVVKMVTNAVHFDEAVLFGGDSDYLPAIDHLNNLGKITTGVCHPHMISFELRNALHQFIDLNTLRPRIARE